jgi:hypothetical protein
VRVALQTTAVEPRPSSSRSWIGGEAVMIFRPSYRARAPMGY